MIFYVITLQYYMNKEDDFTILILIEDIFP